MFAKFMYICALLALCNYVCCLAEDNNPSCLDEEGNSVDWFIAYKFPNMRDQPQPFKSGLSYAYITSKPTDSSDGVDIEEILNDEPQTESPTIMMRIRMFMEEHIGSGSSGPKRPSSRRGRKPFRKSEEAEASSSKWIVSKRLITDPNSIVMRSLKMTYSGSNWSQNGLNWMLYNDQPPEDENLRGPSSKKAHAKGVVIMNTTNRNGMWLTHSVPQFPPPVGKRLHFDENVSKYGQTFMCINFDVKLAGLQIAHHLDNMNALVYDSKIGEDLFRTVPGLDEFKSGWIGTRTRRQKIKNKEQAKLKQVISTRAGQELSIYSKSSELEADLYAGWLEHELGSSLYVESWQNGNGNPLNSSCSDPDYTVNNVRELRLYNDDSRSTVFSWQHQKDHSKWAISETKNRGLVCIADINRMESQFERGGGAVCMRCSNCWNVFSNTILDVEPCHNRRQKLLKKSSPDIRELAR